MTEPAFAHVVSATGETPAFAPGDRIKVGSRVPISQYRVPIYLRGKTGTVLRVIEPSLIDNAEKGYGRDAGNRRRYCRISVMMTAVWRDYKGAPGMSCKSRSTRLGWSGWHEWHPRRGRPRPRSCARQPGRQAGILQRHGNNRSRAADRDGPDRRRQIKVLDSRSPALGAAVVAKAWVDSAFKARLLENGRRACEEHGISFYDDTNLIVLENTASAHNLIVAEVIATPTASYANPAVVLGAWASAGPVAIGAGSVLPYVAAEIAGALLALGLVSLLFTTPERTR